MDKKKRLILLCALVLTVVLVLVLCVASCQKTEEEEEKPPHIGLCLRQYDDDPEFGQELQARLAELGYEVTVADAKNDQTRQTEQIQAFLNEESVLLVIEPVIVADTESTVRLLMEHDVPGVFINYEPEESVLSMWNKLSYVGSTVGEEGGLQGQIILQTEDQGDLNEDGQVSCLVISGPEDHMDARLQAEGCIRAMTDGGLTVSQIETSWGDWTEEGGRQRCAKALSQYGKDVEVIICGNEAATLGALRALENGGWQVGRDFYLVGIGEERAEELTGTVVRDLDGLFRQTVAAAKDLIAGEAVEKTYYVNHKILTPEKEGS